MSATRLLVLGVVRLTGPAHGYRIGRELLDWGTGQWANVKWGSIYHALRKLAGEGRLRATVGDGEEAADRTTYELTDEGEAEFLRLLRDALGRNDRGLDVRAAAVVFMTCLPRAEVLALLAQRLDTVRESRASLHVLLESSAGWGKPEHLTELYEMWLTMVEGEIAWAEALSERLRAGAYTMADDDGREFGAPERPVRSPAG